MNLRNHTVRSYDEQLEHLTSLIMQMGSQVRSLLEAARESFRSSDESSVMDAKVADKVINDLDEQVEEAATTVLALQNPMAVDLRFVISILKITTMLERMGDLAKNTVKRSFKMGTYAPESVIVKLERMADVAREMLDMALDAFDKKDNEKAARVWKRDEEIDGLYKEIFALMQENMVSDPKNAKPHTHVVFAAKNIERFADYTTNLAKTVYYVTAGRRADKAVLKELAAHAAKPPAD